jgi:hypothetical protein
MKLAMSFLLQVFWNNDASVVKNVVFLGCPSLTALTYNSLTDIQKFIPLRLFIGSGSLDNC